MKGYKKLIFVLLMSFLALFVTACTAKQEVVDNTLQISASDTPVLTATNTPVPTATNSPTPVPTASNSPTPKPTATNTPAPRPTATNTPTPTFTPTPTPGILPLNELITVIDSENSVNDKVKKRVLEIAEKTYIEMWQYFNRWNPIPVTIEFIHIYDNPAYTVGNHIYVDQDYANNNYEDLDCVTHELCHVVQGYTYTVPGWLAEGIADFARNKFGLYNKRAGWEMREPSETSYYMDGYGTTAAFLTWANDKYGTDLVKKINVIIQDGEYDNNTFTELTGKDVDTLWEEYIMASGVEYEKYSAELPGVTPIPEGTDLGSYLTIVDKSGSLSEDTKKDLENVFRSAYGKICEEFNSGILTKVTLTIDPDETGVAYTTDGGRIVLSADYIKENPEDYDCFTHELVHVAQDYEGNVPGWFVEGMADFGRDMFGINNEKASWRLPLLVSSENAAIDGYRESAAFLKWITEKYDKDAVKKVHQACKAGKYSPLIWKDAVGKPLGVLVGEFYSENCFKLAMQPGDYAGNLIFYRADGEKVRLSSYAGKPTALIFGNWIDDLYEFHTAIKYADTFGNKVNVIVVCTGESAMSPDIVNNQIDDKEFAPGDLEKFDLLYDKDEMFWAFAGVENGYIVAGTPGYVVFDKNGMIALSGMTGAVYWPEKPLEEIDRNKYVYAEETLKRLIKED
ncbi:MAG: DUF4157 domain-containing protein [Lachnospiraceae bacterium]|nr:DUF4157 domain-containing protein [Lachnospiraceae bacterium]